MRKILDALSNVLKFHKGKMLLTTLLTTLFIILLFPFGDLSDFASSQIAAATQNAVFVQFEDVGIGLTPQIGVKLDKVYLEFNGFPPITSDSMTYFPTFGGHKITAEGIMGGQIKMNVSETAKKESSSLKVVMAAKDLNLEEASKIIHRAANIDLEMKGKLALNVDADIPQGRDDGNGNILPASEPPSGDIQIDIQQLVIPSLQVPTQLGQLALPSLVLKSLIGKGRLSPEGKIFIDEMKLGDAKDPLSGAIKGNLGGTFGAGQFQILSYELNLDLSMRNEFLTQPSMDFFAGILDTYQGIGERYKSPIAGGVRYRFKVQTSSLTQPPNVSAATL